MRPWVFYWNDSAAPTDSHSTPIVTQPSSSKPQNKKSRRKQRKDSGPIEPIPDKATNEEPISTPSYDLQGGEVVAEKEVAEKEVSVADPVTTTGEVVTTAIAITTVDKLTLAQTLIEIKAAKPKAVTTAATTITTTIASTRPKAKGIVFLDQEEQASAFTPIVSSSQLPQAKDKGKGKMVKHEKPLKKND
ncbi:hypothetical protein Tco_0524636 [Tanacetum coccineum]